MFLQETDLNVVPGGIIPVMHVSQYDVGRELKFVLYDGYDTADITTGTTVTIEGTKPDGHGFQYSGVLDQNAHTATFVTTEQMTILAGAIECKLTLYLNSQRIGTALFILDVEKAGINDSTIISDTELPLIIAQATEQMERAEAAADAAALSETNAATSETNAATSETNAANSEIVCGSFMRMAGASAASAEQSAIISGSFMRTAGNYADEAEASAASANVDALKSEGHALGTQNGTPVSSDSPYYHNNAKYWADEARQSSAGGVAASVIATAEPTNISSHAYAIGDQFVYNGILYTATSAISVGETITPGTNCSISDTITEQIGNAGHTILDEDGVTYPQRSKLQFEGCEVTDDAVNGITVVKCEGGGGGGHTIVDEEGTELTQRSKLQFKGAIVSDDETNDETVVETVNPVEYEEDIYGVNLLNVRKSINTNFPGMTSVVNADDSVTISGTTSGIQILVQYSARIFLDKAVRLEQGVEYIYSIGDGIENCELSVGYTNDNGTFTQVAVAPVGSGTLRFTSPVSNKPWTVQLVATQAVTLDNVVTYPMLRKATIQDDTYRPYNQQSIQNQITEQTNVLGAKNLIPYPYYDGDAKTLKGITSVVNSDKSITANGTATADVGFAFCYNKPLSYFGIYQPGKYIISCGDFRVESGDRVYVAIKDTTKGKYYNSWRSGTSSDNNPEQEMVIDSNNINDTFDCYIWFQSGVTVNNAVVKPMLRLASDPDNTYTPYAMTNRELTEGVQGVQSTLRRTRKNITSSLSNLSTAVSEQDLGKYGYTIGNYFTGASGYTYTLADMNTFEGTATPFCITGNHLGIVVATHATSKWHTGSASSVGYNGSTLHSYLKGTVLTNIKSDLTALFGDWNSHLLAHSKLLTTATAAWGWQVDQYISALTCTQVDGGSQWTANGYQEGEASKSLELFRKYKWTEIFGNEYVWLRNISNHDTSAGFACDAGTDGCLSGRGGVTHDYSVAGLIIFN